jgi:hypothetical protein
MLPKRPSDEKRVRLIMSPSLLWSLTLRHVGYRGGPEREVQVLKDVMMDMLQSMHAGMKA